MSSKQKALIALQASRRTGARMTDSIVIEEKKVYDELTEEQYQKHVRDNRKKNDFIADDGGDDLGYNDDGEEHWDEQDNADDDVDDDVDEVEGAASSSSSKRKQKVAPTEKRTAASLLARRSASTTVQPPTKIATSLTNAKVEELVNDVDDDEEDLPAHLRSSKPSMHTIPALDKEDDQMQVE
jgi:hypothetical protein